MSDKKILKIKIKDNLKGVSPVVATVLLVGMTVFVTAIVWVIVDNIVEDEMKKGDACFGVFDKVSLNDRFTCYNSDSNELEFSIDVEDIEIEGILVGIFGNENSTNFMILKETSEISGLEMYGEDGGKTDDIVAPEKNSGRTYVFDLSLADIDEGELISISIAPLIDEIQCEVSDSLSDFSNCMS